MEKTEKQKMLSGELYLASDPELAARSKLARSLLRKYNLTTEEELAKRHHILQELFGKIGANISIVPPFHCDYGENIHVGDNFYMNYGCIILDCNTVSIGENVLCAPYVQIYAAHHPIEPEIRLSGKELGTPIEIGNNVWIGGGAIICPGVTIGDNTTIGAGSVVAQDIPPNVIAAGNPCRIIRRIKKNQ
ncbi:MAG: sugar O-acetyltransferase [Cyanobacteria bacterium P01_A01_bin.45]